MKLAIWTSDPRQNLNRSIVAAGCLYELVALYTTLPTITELVTRPRRHPFVWLGWLALCMSHFTPRRIVVLAAT